MKNGDKKNNTYNTIFHWHKFRFKIVLEGAVVGLLTGFIIVLYRYLIEKSSILMKTIYKTCSGNISKLVLLFSALILISFIIGKIIKKNPMSTGSGIPQVEGILLRKLDMNWFKVIINKFVAGILALAAGLSLGREGPSVQMGACVGQGFGRIFKRLKIEEKFLITSGASAGLSAAFNAPLAGVIFALEEVHKNFSPFILLSAMSASLVSDFVSKQFFGLKPVLDFENTKILPLKYYFFLIVLGVLIGIFGVIFNKTLLKTQDLYKKQTWLPVECRPIIPFVIAGILGLFAPNLLGGGHGLIMALTSTDFSIKILLLFLAIKFFFTMISYGSGVPGGIFFPLLVIGALLGNVYGSFVVKYFNLDPVFIQNFIILAMAGYFTAIVKAPITGSILITEMTGSFNHLLALTIVSIVSYLVTDALNSSPIYESLLDRMLNKNNNKFKGDHKKKILLEFAVTLGSSVEGELIKNLKWPKDCLLVAVKRGDEEIIPKGDTLILGGDYLLVLVDEDKASSITDTINTMSSELCVVTKKVAD